jgi:integrase
MANSNRQCSGLTDARLRALRPRETSYEVADGHGLFAEVLPKGTIAWRYRYWLHGRREKLSLGTWPATGLKAARLAHLEARAMVERGESPAASKRARKAAARADLSAQITVEEFAKVFVRDKVLPVRKDPEQVERYIRLDINPELGGIAMRAVAPSHAWQVVDRLRHRGAEQAAIHVHGILKRMFRYAVARNVIPYSPIESIRSKEVGLARARDRVLSKDELGEVLRRMYESGRDRAHKLALHLLAITMVRRGELVRARWDNVRLGDGEWHIPKEDSKTRAPHIVYLSTPAATMFAELQSLAGSSEWVFPMRKDPRRPMAEATLNKSLTYVDWGTIPSFTLHDLRRTASTHLHEMEFASDVIEAALNHRIPGIRGIYNRARYAEPRKRMLQQWADIVEGLRQDASKIVLFKRPEAA